MSRPLTILGFGVVTVAALAYQLSGILGRRTPTLAEALEPLRSRLAGRAALVGVWLWVGWHLFVRGAWR